MKAMTISQERMRKSLCINCFQDYQVTVPFKGWDRVAGWVQLKPKTKGVVTEGCRTSEGEEVKTLMTPSQLGCGYPNMHRRGLESQWKLGGKGQETEWAKGGKHLRFGATFLERGPKLAD